MKTDKNSSLAASHLLALEPRLLFDAAAAVAGVDVLSDQQSADDQPESTNEAQQPMPSWQPVSLVENSEQHGHNSIFIIDQRVADHQSLLAALPDSAQVYLVGADQSGLAILDQALTQSGTVAEVHIISHGQSAELTLGQDILNPETLAQHAGVLQNWSGALTEQADILLYGCDIAATEQGSAFIEQLATLTGADVAASDDMTGSAERGGDWQLERTTGAIEATTLNPTTYTHTLAATEIVDSDADGNRTTAEDTPVLISGVSVSGGNGDTITLQISTTGGVSTLGSLSGLNVVSNSNGSADFSVSGTIADINSALASLSFSPELNQNSSTSGFNPAVTLSVTTGGTGMVTVDNLRVTAVNDAPDLTTQVALTVQEGESQALTLAQLASSANALDADIATGQQQIEQPMVQVDSLPGKGTLTYKGGVVTVGLVVPVTDLTDLIYTHNGNDLASNDSDNFAITVTDGGGGSTSGAVSITLTPKNIAPVISGAPELIEGQVKGVAPTIDFGDNYDDLNNASIELSNFNDAGQGHFFLDANNDNVAQAGEILTGNVTLTQAQRQNLATQLKFVQTGAEPNAIGVTSPSYQISVTDGGGGEGNPLTTTEIITIAVQPNNDDPTLTNNHSNAGAALNAGEGEVTLLTNGMLLIADNDINPANNSQTTPVNQLVYTLETLPQEGEIQLFVGNGAGYNNDGWITLGEGGRFTQQQINDNQVRYYQTTMISADTPDQFAFSVRDSAFGFDVWTDPANPTGNREGGVRDTATGPIATQTFHLNVSNTTAPHTNPYEGPPRDATPGYGGSDMTYAFVPGGMTNGNDSVVWNEANVGAGGGFTVTSGMLNYTITRTDTGTGDSVTVSPDETVYTLTAQPGNGYLQSIASGSWQRIPTNGQFTQTDINNGDIRFVHDGSENHTSSFAYQVSDGTANNYAATFAINVTPTNDRPNASGGSEIVQEGAGNSVRLGSTVLDMSDIDLSQDTNKQTGEGAQDFLWFQITSATVDGNNDTYGTIERWDGSQWVAVNAGEWLPSTLLTSMADGATSGLRYVHDGSEPLAYSGGPKVSFDYVVRDDLSDPDNPSAVDSTTPVPNSSGSAQSNQSAPASATIYITPVNNAPQVADTPADSDPSIGATINQGGELTGKNLLLADLAEGSEAVITKAMLTAIDSDNTTIQRQYLITQAPTLGELQLNGSTLGVGSTFSQDDIDNNRLTYRHNGDEVGSKTSGFGDDYHDKFHFVVDDGVLKDSGNGADNNVFLITLLAANDAPQVTAPSGPIAIASNAAANNPVSGFSVADPDLTDGVSGDEQDFVQVTVRLLDQAGNPITDYTSGLAGGGVHFGYTTPTDTSGLWLASGGMNAVLQLQGTQAQVNEALTGLTTTFPTDADAEFQLQVIVDDRLRDGSGALDTSNADANGGELNQGANPGDPSTPVPATHYNWGGNTAVPANDPNIRAAEVTLQASLTNDPATLSAPGTIGAAEDTAQQISGFSVSDAESRAFDTPVSVTVSIPVGSGTLNIGGSGAQSSLTPSGGQAVSISGDNSASITLTGRADDIQAVLNGRNFADSAADSSTGLFFTSASNSNHDQNGGVAGDVTLTASLDDSGSRIGDDSGSGSTAANPVDVMTAITITAINDAPVVNHTTSAVSIGGASPTAVSGFSISDIDSNDGYASGETDGVLQVQVRLLDASNTPLSAGDYTVLGASLGTSASGHGASVDSTLSGNTSALEIRGTLTEINAYLAGLEVTLSNTGGGNLDSSYSVEVIADDRLRDRNSGSLLAGPSANGGSQNQQTGLPPVPANDSFNVYTDSTATANALYNVDTGSRALFVSTINDPGDISANNVSVNESGATLALDASNANITITDPDDNGAATLSATVSVDNGVVISAVGGSGGSVGGLGSNTVTISGATEAQLNTRLQALTVQMPDPDGTGVAEGSDWNGSFDVTVIYNDNGSTGTRPSSLTGDTDNPNANPGDYDFLDGSSNALITTRTLTVTVNPVNDAPLRTSASTALTATVEDSTNSSGDTVANLFASTFTDGKDAVPNSSANNFAGVAISANNASADQGVWQYSTDNGASWSNLPVVSSTSALVLADDAKVRFIPAADFHGTPGTLETRLIDDSNGAVTSGNQIDVSGSNSGGSTAVSDNSNSVTLTTLVTPANDRPGVANASLSAIAEDTSNPTGVSVASIDFSYDDSRDNQSAVNGGGNSATPVGGMAIVGNSANPATEGVWQYNSGSGWTDIGSGLSDNAALVLPTSAQVRFVPVANFNGDPGSLSVRIADSSQSFATGSDISSTTANQTSTWSTPVDLAIVVTPRNDAPSLTHSASNPSVSENASTAGSLSVDPVALLSSGSVADLDLSSTAGLASNTFGAGQISVQLTDGISGDALIVDTTLPAGVTLSGGSGSTALQINLDNDTTLAEVEALLTAIKYQHVGENPTVNGSDLQRNYTVTLSDGNNSQSGGNAGGPSALSAAPINGTISLTGVNDPPVAVNDTHQVSEDSASPATGNLITGAGDPNSSADSDPDNTLAELSITGIRPGAQSAGGALTSVSGVTTLNGSYGTLTVNPDGSYSYQLDNSNPVVNALQSGQQLTETFTYQLADPDGASDQAELSITINGNTDSGTLAINPIDGNGSANGEASVQEAGLTSTSDNRERTGGSLTVSAPDGVKTVTIGTTTFTVAELAALTTSNPSAVINTGEGELVITGIESSSGPGGAPTALQIGYVYTLNTAQDQPGASESLDSIALQVTDASSSANQASGTLNIQIIDDQPQANPDQNSVTQGAGPISGNVVTDSGSGADVLGADGSDPAGPVVALTGGSVGSPLIGSYGSLTLNADGSYGYVLDNNNPAVQALAPGQTLTDSFTYTIADSDGDQASSTLTITVAGPDFNDQPRALDDQFDVSAGQPFSGVVTANDTLSQDGGNTWRITRSTAHGTLIFNPDGSFTYTPDPGYSGPDSFNYRITDVDGDLDSATVTFNVVATNNLPVAVDDAFTTTPDTPLNGSLAANDTPSQDGGNVWSLASQPQHGSVTLNPDGTFTYTPDAGFSGTDSFTYSLTDANGDSVSAQVQLTVGANDQPLAVDDAWVTAAGTPISGSLAANDTPSNDGGNIWSLASQPEHGSVTLTPDGSFTYTPAPGFSGVDSFSYTLTDANGDISQATVRIQVSSAGPLPPIDPANPPADPVRFDPNPIAPPASSVSVEAAWPVLQDGSVSPQLTDGEQAREPSVFFDGAVYTQVPRLPLPFHPIVYVNRAVEQAQQEREQDDARLYSDPRQVQKPTLQGRTLTIELALQPTEFVHQEVSTSQRYAQQLDAIVAGQWERLNLTVEQPVTEPSVPEPSVPEPSAQLAPAEGQPISAAPVQTTPEAASRSGQGAASFSQQLRDSRGRLPLNTME